MKTIQVTKFKSSELNPEFNVVQSIEIDDKPFDSGAFGEVYFCNSINGLTIQSPQVVKIFLDDGSGSADRGYETIVKLQEQIITHSLYLNQSNEKPISKVNALGALPQFSYEGVLNGNKVVGYSANLLSKNEWLLFGNIFNEEDLQKRKALRVNFYNLPLDHRLKMAYDLAEGFVHLGQMKFIYADLNPKNFFVNEKEGQFCLIDFEGGAVNENPEIYGKPGEWLAPEIQEQLLNNNSPIIKVDLNTDTWAVAIGIHFMLFNFHPLFFLKVRGKDEMEEYFKKNEWPSIDKTHLNFRNELSGTYDVYIDKLKNQIPKDLFKAFSDTINRGYRNPNLRLSYKQWINAIKGIMLPPAIIKFTADNLVVIDGVPIKLYWEVDNKAHTVTLDKGIGEVTGKREIELRPTTNTTYTLKAFGHFGMAEQSIDIRVFPTPIMESLMVPVPDIQQYYTIDKLNFHPFNIDLSINIKTEMLEETNDTLIRNNPKMFKISQVITHIKKQIKNL